MKYSRMISIKDINEIKYHLAEEDEETAIEYLLKTYRTMTRDEAVDIIEFYNKNLPS